MKSEYFNGNPVCPNSASIVLECDLTHPNLFQYVPIVPLVKWLRRDSPEDEYVNLYDDPRERFLDAERQQSCYKTQNHYICRYIQTRTCTPKFDGQYMCEILVDLFNDKQLVYRESSMLLSKLLINLPPFPLFLIFVGFSPNLHQGCMQNFAKGDELGFFLNRGGAQLQASSGGALEDSV